MDFIYLYFVTILSLISLYSFMCFITMVPKFLGFDSHTALDGDCIKVFKGK